MRISLSLTNYSWRDGAPGLPSQLARVVRAADAAGLDTVWVPDHLIQAAPGSTLEEPMLEAYTTLGFLAAQPGTVRLGTMVSAATYRSPALLVKAVTTVDVLTGGRAWLGICAGAGTPQSVIALLHRHIVEIVAMPDYRSLIEKAGSIPVSSTPVELQQVITATRDDVLSSIRDLGMQQE